jgi:small-conductance mechanosensitive channel
MCTFAPGAALFLWLCSTQLLRAKYLALLPTLFLMDIEAFLSYKLLTIGSHSFTPATLLGLGLVWLGTVVLLRGIHRVLLRLPQIADRGRRHSLYLIVQYVVWTVAVAIMLEVVGFHVTVLLAGSAALLVGIGLGIQQIFQDIISGVFLLFEGSIEVGDVLVVDQTVGRVSEINLRTSKIITRDGNILIVPNHKFITQTVHNWSHHESSPSKFSTTVGVNYAADAELVRSILTDCVLAQADILKDKPDWQPEVRLREFGTEKMIFEVLYWTHHKIEADALRSRLNFDIRHRLSAAGVSMFE